MFSNSFMKKIIYLIPVALLIATFGCVSNNAGNIQEQMQQQIQVNVLPEKDVPGNDLSFLPRYSGAIRNKYSESDGEIHLNYVIKNGNVNDVYNYYDQKLKELGFTRTYYNTKNGGSVSIPLVGTVASNLEIDSTYEKGDESIDLYVSDNKFNNVKFVSVEIDYYNYTSYQENEEESEETVNLSRIFTIDVPEGFELQSTFSYENHKDEYWIADGDKFSEVVSFYKNEGCNVSGQYESTDVKEAVGVCNVNGNELYLIIEYNGIETSIMITNQQQ